MTYYALAVPAFLLAVFAGNQALAGRIELTENNCVSANTQKAHDTITDYESYSRQSGAKYELEIQPFGKYPMLTMVKSQARYALRTASATDAYVWVVLQPTNVTKDTVYPRFLLKCASSFETPDHFRHDCTLVKERQHYALNDFTSSLKVTAGSVLCRPGEIRLSYKFTGDINSAHVEEIKKEVLRPAGPLAPVISGFFNEENFFRSYYLNFYQSWVRSLTN